MSEVLDGQLSLFPARQSEDDVPETGEPSIHHGLRLHPDGQNVRLEYWTDSNLLAARGGIFTATITVTREELNRLAFDVTNAAVTAAGRFVNSARSGRFTYSIRQGGGSTIEFRDRDSWLFFGSLSSELINQINTLNEEGDQ